MSKPTGGYQKAIDDACAILGPYIDDILRRINVDQFTTLEFISALQLDENAAGAFQYALNVWPERDEQQSRMVMHGQVVPLLLRRSELVEWSGYAHGEEDPYGVPAWWTRILPKGESEPNDGPI